MKTALPQLSRRAFALGLPLVAAGCIDRPLPFAETVSVVPARYGPPTNRYGAITTEPFEVPEVDLQDIDPDFLRTMVPHDGAEAPGTIIVDTQARHLYLVQDGGRAMRYGVGVGREGLDWSGRALVGRKAEWPRWIPTKDMIAREPQKYRRWQAGMDGGLENPLGARALYLYQNNRDTYYRIHGTNEPWSIGTSVSSGCIRMINQDVIDLYERVPVGSPVLVA